MTNALALTDVRRRFGKAVALDGLTLSVRRGEVYGFLGRNGAGKTTTLRILTGVLRADAGTVEVLGQVLKQVPVELKRRIGSVSQEQHFYPWMTGHELGRFVAGFYPTWDQPEFERLAKVLDVPLQKKSMELSGGTRTKLGLALALAPRPDLLLLDEPTTGLDPVARREFNDLVSAIVKERGCTAFLSSHLVDEVQLVAHRVGIIQAGKMRIEGEVPWLLESVRRVVTPLAFEPPPGFERVRGDVWRAAPEAWAAAVWPEGVVDERLSLEDVFLAFARTDAVVASSTPVDSLRASPPRLDGVMSAAPSAQGPEAGDAGRESLVPRNESEAAADGADSRPGDGGSTPGAA
ncbi:MAG: ABC transporter ATP-binding protein [Myxococcaceae bacterium]|jgi:ABC-2 type transport system ATP-binding protein|nr:ABC transporter ATP-binding protein [Myxococcaceae bacterium]